MSNDDEYHVVEEIEDETLYFVASLAKTTLRERKIVKKIFEDYEEIYNKTLKERCSAKSLQVMNQNYKSIFPPMPSAGLFNSSTERKRLSFDTADNKYEYPAQVFREDFNDVEMMCSNLKDKSPIIFTLEKRTIGRLPSSPAFIDYEANSKLYNGFEQTLTVDVQNDSTTIMAAYTNFATNETVEKNESGLSARCVDEETTSAWYLHYNQSLFIQNNITNDRERVNFRLKPETITSSSAHENDEACLPAEPDYFDSDLSYPENENSSLIKNPIDNEGRNGFYFLGSSFSSSKERLVSDKPNANEKDSFLFKKPYAVYGERVDTLEAYSSCKTYNTSSKIQPIAVNTHTEKTHINEDIVKRKEVEIDQNDQNYYIPMQNFKSPGLEINKRKSPDCSEENSNGKELSHEKPEGHYDERVNVQSLITTSATHSKVQPMAISGNTEGNHINEDVVMRESVDIKPNVQKVYIPMGSFKSFDLNINKRRSTDCFEDNANEKESICLEKSEAFYGKPVNIVEPLRTFYNSPSKIQPLAVNAHTEGTHVNEYVKQEAAEINQTLYIPIQSFKTSSGLKINKRKSPDCSEEATKDIASESEDIELKILTKISKMDYDIPKDDKEATCAVKFPTVEGHDSVIPIDDSLKNKNDLGEFASYENDSIDERCISQPNDKFTIPTAPINDNQHEIMPTSPAINSETKADVTQDSLYFPLEDNQNETAFESKSDISDSKCDTSKINGAVASEKNDFESVHNFSRLVKRSSGGTFEKPMTSGSVCNKENLVEQSSHLRESISETKIQPMFPFKGNPHEFMYSSPAKNSELRAGIPSITQDYFNFLHEDNQNKTSLEAKSSIDSKGYKPQVNNEATDKTRHFEMLKNVRNFFRSVKRSSDGTFQITIKNETVCDNENLAEKLWRPQESLFGTKTLPKESPVKRSLDGANQNHVMINGSISDETKTLPKESPVKRTFDDTIRNSVMINESKSDETALLEQLRLQDNQLETKTPPKECLIKDSFKRTAQESKITTSGGGKAAVVIKLRTRDNLPETAISPKVLLISSKKSPKQRKNFAKQALKFLDTLKERKDRLHRYRQLFTQDRNVLSFLYTYMLRIGTALQRTRNIIHTETVHALMPELGFKIEKLLNKEKAWELDVEEDIEVLRDGLKKIDQIQQEIRMENKSHKENKKPMNLEDFQRWEERLKIVNKTADDMILLQEICRPSMIHFGSEIENLFQLFIIVMQEARIVKYSGKVSSMESSLRE